MKKIVIFIVAGFLVVVGIVFLAYHSIQPDLKTVQQNQTPPQNSSEPNPEGPSPESTNSSTDSSTSPQPSKPVSSGKCYIGGCSAQICSDQPDTVSTCIYNSAYACYKTATCERQTDGQCGWTQTSALSACLNASANKNQNSPQPAQ